MRARRLFPQVRRLPLWFALAALLAVGALPRLGAAQDATPAATPAATVREILAGGDPVGAPGQVLQLVRYVIPPHTKLPTHEHPGMQVALIESGVLHYTVVTGEVPITRAGSTTTPAPVEPLKAGQSTDIYPGDWFVEAQGVVHFGENQGDEPVVILVASLFATDQPPAILVNLATPAA